MIPTSKTIKPLSSREIFVFRITAFIFLFFSLSTYFVPFISESSIFKTYSIGSDIFLLFILVSSFIKRINKNIDYLFSIWLFSFANLILYITFITSADPLEILFTSLFSLISLNLPFRNRITVYFMNTYTYIGLIIIVWFVDINALDKYTTLSFLLLYFAFIQIAFYRKYKLTDQKITLTEFPENNPSSVVELSLTGKLNYYNPATQKLFPDIYDKSSKHPIFTNIKVIMDKLVKNPQQEFARKIQIGDRYFQQKIIFMPIKDSLYIYTYEITQIYKYTRELNDTKIELENEKLKLESLLNDLSEEKDFESIRNQILVDNITEGIVLTDEYGRVTYINESFTNDFGYKPEELIDKDLADVIKVYDLNEKESDASQLSNSAAITAHDQTLKVKIAKKNGTLVPVDIRGAAVSVQGKFRGVVRLFHDITEEVKLAQQKDDFFSIASHELRTPLTVISGNIDIILQGYSNSKLSPDDKELLEDTLMASDRLIKMVNEFLNVSRLDQGRLKTNMQILDPCKIAESVVKEMKSLTDEKGIDLIYDCDKSHKMVSADEGLFKEILINLIGNSIKFTEKGNITLTNSVQGKNMIIRVSDTGIGIEKDKQSGLFARFQQAMSKTLARQAGGTGLGLYISREFARKMGGELILEKSVYGKGSIFKLTLPIVETENTKKVKKSPKTDE